MEDDLIVLGAPAETQAAGGEDGPRAGAGPTEEEILLRPVGDIAQPGEEPAEPEPAPTPNPETPKGTGEDGGEPEKPKKRTGITRMQERIARLEADLASARSAAPAAGGDRTAAIDKAIGPVPKESDFKDFLEYEDARQEYRLKKVLAEQRLAEQETSSATRAQAVREEAVEAFNDRLDEAREKIPDFDKVLASAKGREVSPHVTELIVDSEKGGLLAYYLAKTPERLAELNRMSPVKAAKAEGALEHRLTLAKPKKAPAAPAPGRPVSGAATPKSADAEIDAWLASAYGGRTSR